MQIIGVPGCGKPYSFLWNRLWESVERRKNGKIDIVDRQWKRKMGIVERALLEYNQPVYRTALYL